jgi:hypothetical protein
VSPAPTLAERFRARLEAELQYAERTLAAHREKYGQPLAGNMEDGLGPLLQADGPLDHREGVEMSYEGRLNVPLVAFLVSGWPEGLHEPLGYEEALAVVRAEAEAIVQAAVLDVESLVSMFVPADVRTAVLSRDGLLDRWPWPIWSLPLRTAVSLDALLAGVEVATAPPRPWMGSDKLIRTTSVAKALAHARLEPPPAVALLDVLTWSQKKLAAHAEEGPEAVKEEVARASSLTTAANRVGFALRGANSTRAFMLRAPDAEHLRRVDPWTLGLMYEAVRDVERGARLPGLVLSADGASRSMLEGMVHLPKDTRQEWEVVPSGGYYELAVPGEAEQYVLTLPGVHMSEAMQAAIRTLRGPKGVRHWLAFHVGFTGLGRRSGELRWTVEDHLDALQVPLRQRRRSELVEECLGMAELFLHMELLRRPTARSRDFHRAPIFHVRNWNGRENAGRLRLDGVNFGINEWLYRGARKESGELGENFAWAPAELAGIDHVRHPYAVTLGPVLAIRWRLAYAEDGRDFLRVSGENVLRAAGAAKGYKARDPGRTWKAIVRDLEELQRRNALGAFEWDGAPGLRSNLVFHMPTLMRDRMLHGVRPVESAAPPSTGEELRAWREGRGLSQAQLAALLDVVVSTVSRAERRSAERLPTPFREALRRALASPALDALPP